MRTCDNIWKMASSQGVDYKNGCLLDYNYFNKSIVNLFYFNIISV